MSWIQDNKVPAAIIGLTGAGVAGLGFLLFSAWSAASEAQEQFEAANMQISSLKSASLAPTPENLAQKEALVKAYETEVGKLSKVLFTLQPADKPMSATEFQAKLKTTVAEIKRDGAGRLPGEFNLGFDEYARELPKNDQMASELSTYLDSVNEVTRLALKSGINSLIQLERSPLPTEKPDSNKPQGAAKKAAPKGAAAAAPAIQITERRQVRLTINTDQAALQTLLSGLASPSDMRFFTVVRLLRIENEVQQGPARVPVVTLDTGGEEPQVVDPNASVTPAAIAAQPAKPDSIVVLGRENLRAYLEIDLVKFLNPQTAAAASSSGR